MLTFSKNYFGLAILVFLIEVFIALFVHDGLIRPYMGDVLVVILIYCFVKAFLDLPVAIAALFVLAFSFAIEILQYFNIVEKLGLRNSKVAQTVIGNSFAWIDLAMYAIGILAVIAAEKYRDRPVKNNA